MKKLLLTAIKTYQSSLSPYLPTSCRYYPTCSEYCFQAITKYGLTKGLCLTLIRLTKCNPLGKTGYDPVL